jgi:hypothetical protein
MSCLTGPAVTWAKDATAGTKLAAHKNTLVSTLKGENNHQDY